MKKLCSIPAVVAMCVLSACTTLPPSNVDIIAHRGAPHLAPENTLVSARLAWERGADAVEVDVRQTLDGQLVVIHDSSTLRVAKINMFIRHVTFDEIKDLDVGFHYLSRYSGEGIPLLSDILAIIPAGKQLYIEIKTDSTIVPELTRLLLESGKADKVRIISFNTKALEAVKKALPFVPCYLLKLHVPRNSYPALIDDLKARNLDGVDLFHPSVTPELVALLHSHDFECITWTVDGLRTAGRLISYGVNGITTNVAGWFKKKMR